ncbi:MAG TPA: hypothetical protein VNP04_13595 [Alphaproteobacteria bacterium]|nr:hypothetical protein [Alphaproteobacteria bacterium]
MATMDLTLQARVSAGNAGPVQTNAASASITVSAYQVTRLTIANGVSDFIYSVAQLSAPSVIILVSATSVCRVNWTNASVSAACAYSAGSAGVPFKDLFVIAGSGAAMPSALHFSNSSGDSATFTVIVGM